MFQGAVDVATEMMGKVGTIKNQRDNRRVRIANFFDKVGVCLEKILEAVNANQTFDDHIEEIEMYVDAFSSAVGDIIGFELSDRLVELLRTALDEKNFKTFASLSGVELDANKKTLKEASDKFIDLWSALK